MANRVSLAELTAADIRLRPAEAVTIVSAICAQHIAGELPGIPSPGVIRLTRDGDLVIEGPITTAQDTVKRAALLLTDLLAGFDALPEYRASGALRLIIARAVGSIDLPAYGSLEEFHTALARFASEDVRDVARALFCAWERASVTRAFKAAPRADLTISDVRRARRATGLSLSYLSTVAEVPPTRLRDLEWGYMREWPATAEARAQVIRYARAAGLDESIVLSIAWPMILEHASADVVAASSTALVPAAPRTLVVAAASTRVVHPPRWRAAIIAAAATAALLGAFALGWRSSAGSPALNDGLQVGISGQAPPPPAVGETDGPAAPQRGMRVLPIGAERQAEPEPPQAMAAAPAPAPARIAPAPAAAPPKTKRRRAPGARPAHADQTRDQPRKSVFDRELFRIVIK